MSSPLDFFAYLFIVNEDNWKFHNRALDVLLFGRLHIFKQIRIECAPYDSVH